MDKKNTLLRFGALMLLAILITPMLFSGVAPVSAVQYNTSWHTTEQGVLDSDYYDLYPYAQKSLKIGLSQWGELIGITPGADPNVQANWVGLEYDGRDPFCPATVIPMASWINGWYIDIQYTDPSLSGTHKDRHLWAFAMFADGLGWGGDWVTVTLPTDEPHGGRKTNGVCLTDPLQILYHGPRGYVAMSVTHINDKDGATTWPVVDLVITIIFNKVKKEVILLKDVKLTIPKSHLWDRLDVQLSNREEYDLGPSPSYDSYAHFYDQEGECCLTSDWHLATDLLREYVEHVSGVGGPSPATYPLSPPGGALLAEDFMKIWINGVFQDPSKYTVDYVAKTVKFAVAPAKDSDIEFHYKFVYKAEGKWDHEYDIAQVISSDNKYVAWTAMWPSVSDYTVDGMLRFLDPLIMVSEPDMTYEPKQSPVIIGEWDFLMDHEVIDHFRCVEVKGVTDLHDADDEDIDYGHTDVIDREVMYQLNEIFMPWDLESALDYLELYERWVAFGSGGASVYTILTPTPLYEPPYWDAYCNFAEKVLVDGVLIARRGFERLDPVPAGSGTERKCYRIEGAGTQIHFQKSSDGITYSDWAPPAGAVIKLLYSRDKEPPRYEWMIVGRDSAAVDSAGAAMVTEWLDSHKNIELGLSGLDMQDPTWGPTVPYVFEQLHSSLLPSRNAYRGITHTPPMATDDPTNVWGPNTGRAVLRDDHCHTWPIESSNMIGVGGFYANLFAEYFNDFTDARFDPDPLSLKIETYSCWSKNKYGAGYGVVATYKDLDGTVGLLIWGYTGDDTYWLTYAIKNQVGFGEALQNLPDCVTAVVVKIDYSTCPPTCSIVEKLGTVSELIVHPDP